MMETESAMNRVNRNRQKILPERNVTMKFFHLSDLHIGLKLMNRDLREDQEYILSKIVEAAGREETDAVVIAGDIYDKAVPSAEAVEVFDRFLEELTETVPNAVIMMISGNHDSAPRVNCFRNVLSRQKVYMIGQPPRTEAEYIEKVVLHDAYGNVNFYLLPFVKPSMVKQKHHMEVPVRWRLPEVRSPGSQHVRRSLSARLPAYKSVRQEPDLWCRS